MGVDKNTIEQHVQRIVDEFRPHRVILFGSHARGETTSDSDVDLLIVLPFQGKSWEMASEIRRRIRFTFPVDLILRTPDQLKQRLAIRDSFLSEITKNGTVLYAA